MRGNVGGEGRPCHWHAALLMPAPAFDDHACRKRNLISLENNLEKNGQQQRARDVNIAVTALGLD
eukprot:scaffold216067_cov15-Tisochrysis_lutea.AAC.1